MAKKNRVGLLSPFTVNRPLNRREKQHHYRQGQIKKHGGEAAVMSFDTVITMNSTYLEVVDNDYKKIGQLSSLLMVFFIIFMTFLIAMIIRTISRDGSLISLFFLSVLCISFLFILGKFILFEWFRKTHYPVRFNRQKQLVHVYQTNNEILTLPWKDIYFTTYEWRNNVNLVGHILDKDGETVLNTFGFGYWGDKVELDHYWEFIRCYMEEDCLEELADTVTLCPPIADKKESYIFGLQYIIKMESRLAWIFFLFMLPIYLMESLARFIAMQTSKIPQWSQEVLDDCIVSPNDPIQIDARINPPHLWRYVLANESLDIYQARYDKQQSANQRIKAKLKNTYEL
ncbi:DUF6708 domain-containing protein [Providencia vermicola]|uniref:DUF6708 domain-containing protein n=1 Tax=Providencia vermicola TaxID=333965 RepID=A0AAX3RXG2_9GAMM|nr:MULTISPECIES: DUF6708 domain-containing protein [Providencia]ELX8379047.1 hypothetical protein [Providencia stuartii]EMD5258251.1 hypothetical protein [Providencia stuartii]USB36724.1 hypothetical protein M5J11_18345 [Providencia vermicola]WFC05655.1 hypothetical protein PG365_13100 [Providencia vermicola]